MKEKISILFIVLILKIFASEIEIKYKEGKPYLGRNNYLELNNLNIPYYENNDEYSSTVEIKGEIVKRNKNKF